MVSALHSRPFGTTGLAVTPLGLGGGQIGSSAISEEDAGVFLNTVLDSGVNLIDTARGYGLSEERIGRHIGHRRSEFVLSTKVGYDIPGYPDWTGPTITAGIDAALNRLRTDYIDIVHLHSCSLETLKEGSVIAALEEAVRAGKVRVAAYSGENESMHYAIETKRFKSIETSVNICDQRSIPTTLAQAKVQGLGVIAKRPVANAPWRFATRPTGDYAEVYWDRWQAMGIDPRGLDWQELALRFTAFLPGVSSAIVGTSNLAHFTQAVTDITKGPLPADHVAAIQAAFQAHDQDWVGQV